MSLDVLLNNIRVLGVLCILISVVTWGMELSHMVEVCPYCQTQRTMIGLLGLLMVLPNIALITPWLTLIVGLFGTHVACAQLFMHTKELDFINMFTILAFFALCLMSAQMLLLFERSLHRQP